jgi:hypothetical protein
MARKGSHGKRITPNWGSKLSNVGKKDSAKRERAQDREETHNLLTNPESEEDDVRTNE